MTWLTTQAFTGAAQTTSFNVTNGVRQGGILLSKPIVNYFDKSSEQLESSKVGGHF